MSDTASRPRARRGFKLILAAVSAVLTLGILEGAARLYVWKSYGSQSHGMNWKFDYEPYLETSTNKKFLSPQPKGDKFRVLVIGGSTASLLPEQDVIEAIQPLVGRPVDVVNMGQGSFIVNQERIMLLLHGMSTKPDLLLTLDGVNDIVTVSKTKQPGITYADNFIRSGVEHPVLNGMLGLIRDSQFVNCVNKLRERGVEGKVHQDGKLLESTVDHFVEGVSSMATLAHGMGIPHVLAIQPYVSTRKNMHPEEQERAKQYAYRAEFVGGGLRKIVDKLGASPLPGRTFLIDTTPVFDDTKEVCFIDDVHLTESGNKKLMGYIAAKLKEKGFSSTP